MEYMDLFKAVMDKVSEEYSDAKSYAGLAAKARTDTTACKLFLRLSQAEIEHADWLKKEAQELIRNPSGKAVDVDKMQVIWDVKSDDWPDCELEVKWLANAAERG